jgi:hypothetical protein
MLEGIVNYENVKTALIVWIQVIEAMKSNRVDATARENQATARGATYTNTVFSFC